MGLWMFVKGFMGLTSKCTGFYGAMGICEWVLKGFMGLTSTCAGLYGVLTGYGCL